MARCESSHFCFLLYKKSFRQDVQLDFGYQEKRGKEEFSMEYDENDWDMDWDIIEDMYSNLSEKEIEEELMDME